ncbi:UNVERIFIED_CONTAM: hypothetical protein FKN15_059967 [Acipenser sinensis]
MLTGPSDPVWGCSSLPNYTCHFPKARRGPRDPVRCSSSLPNDTCHLPTARTGQPTLCRVPAVRQTIPATFPLRARANQLCAGSQPFVKRYLPPSHCAHGPTNSVQGPSRSSNDTCHLPTARTGQPTLCRVPAVRQTIPATFPLRARANQLCAGSQPFVKRYLPPSHCAHGPTNSVQGPSRSSNDTCHLPTARTGQPTLCRVPAVRQTIPATFPLRARANQLCAGSQPFVKRYLPPSHCAHGPTNSVQGPSRSSNDTCHLPTARTGQPTLCRVPAVRQTIPATFPLRARANQLCAGSQPFVKRYLPPSHCAHGPTNSVQGPSRSSNDTCHLPTARTGQPTLCRVPAVRQTIPATFPLRARANQLCAGSQPFVKRYLPPSHCAHGPTNSVQGPSRSSNDTCHLPTARTGQPTLCRVPAVRQTIPATFPLRARANQLCAGSQPFVKRYLPPSHCAHGPTNSVQGPSRSSNDTCHLPTARTGQPTLCRVPAVRQTIPATFPLRARANQLCAGSQPFVKRYLPPSHCAHGPTNSVQGPSRSSNDTCHLPTARTGQPTLCRVPAVRQTIPATFPLRARANQLCAGSQPFVKRYLPPSHCAHGPTNSVQGPSRSSNDTCHLPTARTGQPTLCRVPAVRQTIPATFPLRARANQLCAGSQPFVKRYLPPSHCAHGPTNSVQGPSRSSNDTCHLPTARTGQPTLCRVPAVRQTIPATFPLRARANQLCAGSQPFVKRYLPPSHCAHGPTNSVQGPSRSSNDTCHLPTARTGQPTLCRVPAVRQTIPATFPLRARANQLCAGSQPFVKRYLPPSHCAHGPTNSVQGPSRSSNDTCHLPTARTGQPTLCRVPAVRQTIPATFPLRARANQLCAGSQPFVKRYLPPSHCAHGPTNSVQGPSRSSNDTCHLPTARTGQPTLCRVPAVRQTIPATFPLRARANQLCAGSQPFVKRYLPPSHCAHGPTNSVQGPSRSSNDTCHLPTARTGQPTLCRVPAVRQTIPATFPLRARANQLCAGSQPFVKRYLPPSHCAHGPTNSVQGPSRSSNDTCHLPTARTGQPTLCRVPAVRQTIPATFPLRARANQLCAGSQPFVKRYLPPSHCAHGPTNSVQGPSRSSNDTCHLPTARTGQPTLCRVPAVRQTIPATFPLRARANQLCAGSQPFVKRYLPPSHCAHGPTNSVQGPSRSSNDTCHLPTARTGQPTLCRVPAVRQTIPATFPLRARANQLCAGSQPFVKRYLPPSHCAHGPTNSVQGPSRSSNDTCHLPTARTGQPTLCRVPAVRQTIPATFPLRARANQLCAGSQPFVKRYLPPSHCAHGPTNSVQGPSRSSNDTCHLPTARTGQPTLCRVPAVRQTIPATFPLRARANQLCAGSQPFVKRYLPPSHCAHGPTNSVQGPSRSSNDTCHLPTARTGQPTLCRVPAVRQTIPATFPLRARANQLCAGSQPFVKRYLPPSHCAHGPTNSVQGPSRSSNDTCHLPTARTGQPTLCRVPAVRQTIPATFPLRARANQLCAGSQPFVKRYLPPSHCAHGPTNSVQGPSRSSNDTCHLPTARTGQPTLCRVPAVRQTIPATFPLRARANQLCAGSQPFVKRYLPPSHCAHGPTNSVQGPSRSSNDTCHLPTARTGQPTLCRVPAVRQTIPATFPLRARANQLCAGSQPFVKRYLPPSHCAHGPTNSVQGPSRSSNDTCHLPTARTGQPTLCRVPAVRQTIPATFPLRARANQLCAGSQPFVKRYLPPSHCAHGPTNSVQGPSRSSNDTCHLPTARTGQPTLCRVPAVRQTIPATFPLRARANQLCAGSQPFVKRYLPPSHCAHGPTNSVQGPSRSSNDTCHLPTARTGQPTLCRVPAVRQTIPATFPLRARANQLCAGSQPFVKRYLPPSHCAHGPTNSVQGPSRSSNDTCHLPTARTGQPTLCRVPAVRQTIPATFPLRARANQLCAGSQPFVKRYLPPSHCAHGPTNSVQGPSRSSNDTCHLPTARTGQPTLCRVPAVRQTIPATFPLRARANQLCAGSQPFVKRYLPPSHCAHGPTNSVQGPSRSSNDTCHLPTARTGQPTLCRVPAVRQTIPATFPLRARANQLCAGSQPFVKRYLPPSHCAHGPTNSVQGPSRSSNDTCHLPTARTGQPTLCRVPAVRQTIPATFPLRARANQLCAGSQPFVKRYLPPSHCAHGPTNSVQGPSRSSNDTCHLPTARTGQPTLCRVPAVRQTIPATFPLRARANQLCAGSQPFVKRYLPPSHCAHGPTNSVQGPSRSSNDTCHLPTARTGQPTLCRVPAVRQTIPATFPLRARANQLCAGSQPFVKRYLPPSHCAHGPTNSVQGPSRSSNDTCHLPTARTGQPTLCRVPAVRQTIPATFPLRARANQLCAGSQPFVKRYLPPSHCAHGPTNSVQGPSRSSNDTCHLPTARTGQPTLCRVPAVRQTIPATFPLRARANQLCAGSQPFVKRYLPPSHCAHGPTNSVQGPSRSSNDTCHLPTARTGQPTLCRVPAVRQTIPATFPLRARANQLCAGSQPFVKRYLPPSHCAHGPTNSVQGPSRSSNDTCHLPTARTGQPTLCRVPAVRQTIPATFPLRARANQLCAGSQPFVKRYLPPSHCAHGPTNSVQGPSRSSNDTCHLPTARTGQPTLCRVPAVRQTIPATFPPRARAQAILLGSQKFTKRYLPLPIARTDPSDPVRTPSSLPKNKYNLPTAHTGLSDPVRCPSSSPNDTCHLPTVHSGLNDPVQGPSSSPYDTCHHHTAYRATSHPVWGQSRSPNNTCHLPTTLTGPSNLVCDPSGSPNDTCHLPTVHSGLNDPVQGPSSSPYDTCHHHTAYRATSHPVWGQSRSPNDTCNLPTILTGPSDPVRGCSSSPNYTCHLPKARRAPSDPVRCPSSSPNDTCHLPTARTGPSDPVGVPEVHQTIPSTSHSAH